MSLVPPQTKPPVRVALLVCDGFTPEIYESTYQSFEKWLKDALPSGSQVVFDMTGYNVFNKEYPTEEVIQSLDVVIISGSPVDGFANFLWMRKLLVFIQRIYYNYQHIKLFGVCFGHQMISRALGGMVVLCPKLEYGLTRIHTTYMGKIIFGMEHNSFEIQQIHQDDVPIESLSDYFASGKIYLLGSSYRTHNQGFVKFQERCTTCEEKGQVHSIHEHVHILTTQGHPEFSEAKATDTLYQRAKQGYIRDHLVRAYFGEEGPPEPAPADADPDAGEWPESYDGTHVVGRAFWKMFGVKYET